MDLDGDGQRDVISGSWPGDLYVFKGEEAGTFAEVERIQDAEGEEINLGKASAVFACDWDRDGDLDLVVGDIDGTVYFVPNESGGDALELGEAVEIEAGGEVLSVPRDAGPCVADWDGDGAHDLIVGSGNGSVLFFRNESAEGLPVLAAPVTLVAKPYGGMGITFGEPIRLGVRTKPCVVDWNGDGLLDLLLGDALSEATLLPELSPEERAEKERLEAKMAWIMERDRPAMDRVLGRVLEEMGIEAETGGRSSWYGELSDEQRVRYRELHQAGIEKDVEARALQRLMREISTAQRKYRPKRTLHGHVWLYLREPPGAE